MAVRDGDERVREQLARWRDEVINLARSNRLLYFRHLKTSTLEITAPGHSHLVEGLGGKGLAIHVPPDPDDDSADPAPPRADEVVTDKPGPRQLQNSLTSLARKSEQEFMDKGLWILYLGVGLLRWRDDDDGEALSPVLLLPVQLARSSPREPYRLVRVEEDSTINPALAVKLGEYGIALPQLEDLDETDPEGILAAVRSVVGSRPGWELLSRTVMGAFSFQKEVMYRDLLRNEDAIVAHQLVTALALGSAGQADKALDFEPMPEEVLDDEAPPEEMATILDADASQRQCIVAAREGHSFVMDGPPGTGKSQTIANMIAELVLAGRSVLFVSEKAAALEVVQRRLQLRGLDDFALELHSHKATRREVAIALAEPLKSTPIPGPTLSPTDRSRLIERRRLLSAHAAAMNEIRQPLGRSVHQAIGRVMQLSGAPELPLPALKADLSATEFARCLDGAARLAAAWDPVVRGDDFLWRQPTGLARDRSQSGELRTLLSDAGGRLAALEAAVRDVAEELDLPWWRSLSDARRLAALTDCLAAPVKGEAAWLTAASVGPILERLAELEEAAAERSRLVGTLSASLGAGWNRLEPGLGDELDDAVAEVARAVQAAAPGMAATRPELESSGEFLEFAADTLGRIHGLAEEIGRDLGVGAQPDTLADARRLAEIAELVLREPRPEAAWLTSAGAFEARQALDELRPLVETWTQQRDGLTEVFTDDVLALDLEGLAVRFASVHRGLGKMKGAYREDKRTLVAVTRAQRLDTAVLAKLEAARDWKRTADALASAEGRCAAALGDHVYRREETDLGAVEQSLAVAERIVALTGSPGLTAQVAERLGRGGRVDPALARRSGELSEALESWTRRAEQASAALRAELETRPLTDAHRASAAAAEGLARAARVAGEVERDAGRAAPLGETRTLLSTAAAVAAIDDDIAAAWASDEALLGAGYAGLDTDWAGLREAISWADRVRAVFGGALEERRAAHVVDGQPPDIDLASSLERWDRSVEQIAALFEPGRRGDLTGDLDGMFDDAAPLVRALEDTLGDLDQWEAHVAALDALRASGLGQPVARLIELRADANQVQPAIESCCLRAWINATIDEDSDRLQPALLAGQRDQTLDEFRRLDRELVDGKASEVMARCNARRPRGTAGAAGVIQREAEKKRRHMPVRKLLGDTGGLALDLKPCFLMSPLTVSQFLPQELRFDTVIFDEASQVRPADAINCIYRADQLIVAGDQRQLPPTSFFERFTQDDGDEYEEDQLEDFDSVLDLCKGSGSMRALSLRWHYRSQHESLITYSNYSFYEGRLITFPGAVETGEDVGVELFPVAGVYRRGGARDNPIEASAVADRVLHHARNHPQLSLGVVAFSEAQASAIEAEIDRRRQELADLDSYFDSDRLNGFFVKNLESVQGDERDVVIFSVGYGRDEAGKLTMAFGPLSAVGGQRRLNVAITRARRRVEIVSSITAADMHHDVPSEGARHLRRYLDFAERGLAALAVEVGDEAGDVESPFEDEVARIVRSLGYDVVPQVGSAGYRVDLGVRDPERPGRFVLGIECDGAMYHSSRVARDRDRLRQEVLEGLGWRIHRIWGTTWYRDRNGQVERLRAVLEDARRADPPTPRSDMALDAVKHEARDDTEGDPLDWARPYVPHVPEGPAYGYAMHEREGEHDLQRMIGEVVAGEGPVLADVVLVRVREAWGVQRAGHRIRAEFDRSVAQLARRGRIRRDDDGFLWRGEGQELVVRVPSGHDPSTRRDVNEVHPDEIALAVAGFVADSRRIDREELSLLVARLFGWGRRGAGIARAIDRAADRLLEAGGIVEVGNGWLAPAEISVD